MADDDVVLSRGAADLMSDIIGANVTSLAATTDAIIDGIERERDRFAEALVGLWEAIESAEVLDRTTQRKVWAFQSEVESAYGRLEWNTRRS